MLAVAVSQQMPNQTTAVSNSNTMRNLETAPFNDITQEEVEAYAWASCVKEWTGVALNYIDITDKLANIMLENFETTASYRYNANIIKRAIIEGLPLNMKDIMLASNIVVPKRSKEQKAFMEERQKVQQKVILMYELCTYTLFYYYLMYVG
jgi:hypothetical protein